MRPLLFRAAACSLVWLLAAAGGAQEAKVLNVYNWADYIGPTTLADFEAETGIRVNYDIYDSAETVEAKLLAGSTGYDVIFHSGLFASRLMSLGLFLPLDRARIPNWRHLDPKVLRAMAGYDAGNLHSAPYMWGSTGFAYDAEAVRERLPDAPVESSAMLFDPEVVKHFADCGVSFLGSATDVIPMVLLYLGEDPSSTDATLLARAVKVLQDVRPFVKYYGSNRLLTDLPNREICVAMSWSGDYATARNRATEAGIQLDLAYTVPAEGSVFWFDAMFIPSDAPHPDNAYRFIDFILRPEVIAAITNKVNYANAVLPSSQYVTPEILRDPAVYATPEIVDRLVTTDTLPPKTERLRTRAWARAKSGI